MYDDHNIQYTDVKVSQYTAYDDHNIQYTDLKVSQYTEYDDHYGGTEVEGSGCPGGGRQQGLMGKRSRIRLE